MNTDTPLIRQWREIKSRHPDDLLLFRVGDFYEMFNEDAEEGARLLDLTLTSRNNGSSRAPLAGIPAHSLAPYLRRLIGHGRRVAICEQVEEASEAQGLVRREVTEMVTPGAVLADDLLDARRDNYLFAVAGDPDLDERLGTARVELSTGELTLREVNSAELDDVLAAVEPAEILLPRSWEGRVLPAAEAATLTFRPDWIFDPATAADELRRGLRVHGLDGFGLGGGDALLVGAWGALHGYLAEIRPAGFTHLQPPRTERGDDAMVLDEMTRRNLELVEPLRGTGREGTLLAVIDAAVTPMGHRLLRRWLLAPLLDRGRIAARLEGVAELVADVPLRDGVRGMLGEVRDLQRLAVRAATGRASPRDLAALAGSLEREPRLAEVLADAGAPILRYERELVTALDPLRERLRCALEPEPPANLTEGGVIRRGYSAELDGLRDARDGAVDWIAALQARERTRTGIASLKVGFNKVFGYYLEVTRANLERVPDDYHRKQTLANAERYFTPELKEWEERVLDAEQRVETLESALFAELRELVGEQIASVQRAADRLARLDVLAALAETAARRGYTRPELHDGYELQLGGARHPVVETTLLPGDFIPNDVVLGEAGRVMVLTGPNMAGKSTLLRQVGVICILAQMGSFVPAADARLPVVDRVFTRVGASDHLARGQSTFMVEMHETAAILHAATARSLVLLDEIGRGTATWDGFSVASAVTEYMHDVIGAKCIFATHYHEMTELATRFPGVVNFSVAVREVDDQIVFLRRLVEGGADRSYGVEVARLAGMPDPVVARARQILAARERAADPPSALPLPDAQLPLFAEIAHPAVGRLRDLDTDRLTPLEALQLLAELHHSAVSDSD